AASLTRDRLEPGSWGALVFAAADEGRIDDEQAAGLFIDYLAPTLNYVHGNHDVIHEMLTHPAAINGLSDGGAHVRMICDASIPTYLLTHWARDRVRGPRISVEEAVRLQTSATAEVIGLADRGVIAPGRRADINVIDFENLRIDFPTAVADLPAGGTRLLQSAEGYVATIVNGRITRRNGADTGERPGRLVRA
ncbi:MAG: amidohydrolase family protein, partial [Actinomycetota bacterium]